ncbi:MAG: TonB-dependent receptor [Bacteroidales bacterium]|nr:TonB-dependent receptor [Bacteroidales bacterium]
MRIGLFIFLVSVFQAVGSVGYSQSTKITLKSEALSLVDVLSKIEDQSEYRFIYDKSQIDLDRKAQIDFEEVTVKEVLEELFVKNGVDYQMVGNQVILKNSRSHLLQQQRTISGKVTDSSGAPLPGVTVLVKGTMQGTVTDFDGNYSISNVPGTGTLVFSFVGMRSQEIVIGNQSSIDVVMEQDAIGIEEVVAIGYGTMKKSDLTGSIASVQTETLENAASPNIVQALQGVMPGLSVSINSSNAEQNAILRVRGEQSITASNNPLIILDGIPWDGNLSEIPTADVQSIDVLKDASSTAIYGARGANGVIIITTKKGKIGKTTVSIRSSYGALQLAKKPKVYNGDEFYNYKLDYHQADPEVVFSQTELDNYAAGISTDWVDLVTRTGQQQEHTLTLSGGGENHLFFISGNFMNTKGIAKNDDFSRYSFRLNFQKDLSDWLRFATNTSMVYLDRDGRPAEFDDAIRMNPLTTPFNEDGSIKIYHWPEDPFFTNPLGPLNVQDLNRDSKLFTNNYFDIDIPFIKGLNYRLNTGLTFRYANQETYWDDQTVQGFTAGGVSDVSNRTDISALVENIINYEKLIGDHSIKFTGLYSYQWDEYKTRRVRAEGFPSHVLTTYQESSGALINPTSNLTQTGLVSQMARLNYSYKGKYLFTSTARRDGYSGFGENTKYGVFPSFALSWNLSEENFIAENFDWIEQLKLRTSWGESGNQAIGAYSTLSRLANRDYLTGSTGTTTATGYVPSRLANPGLGWETTKSWNVGLDFIIFDGKLGGSMDVFKSNVNDLLLNREISPVFGIPGSEITENIGKTENRGLEIKLYGTPVKTQDFEWNLSLNYSASRNKIVDLYGDGKDDLLNRWFIGEPISVYYDYAFGGVWQLDDNIEDSAQPYAEPGFAKVIDTNGDGEITPEDRMILGQTFPDFEAGLNSNFKYKNFTLNLFFSGVVGIEKPVDFSHLANAWDYRKNHYDLWDFWTPDNPSNEYPANRLNVNANPHAPIFKDASFVRLKDVRLGYDLSQVGRELINLSKLSIYFNVNNVFTLTKWPGIDPELRNQESIPLQRTYVIGLNVEF